MKAMRQAPLRVNNVNVKDEFCINLRHAPIVMNQQVVQHKRQRLTLRRIEPCRYQSQKTMIVHIRQLRLNWWCQRTNETGFGQRHSDWSLGN